MTLKGRGSESAVRVFALLCESPQWETRPRFDCLPAVAHPHPPPPSFPPSPPCFGGASISRLPRLSGSVSRRFVPAQKRLDASLYFSYTCHHLLYNCFEGFRGVLETRKAVNLCCQWAIERRLFPSASALRKVKFTYLRWRVRQKRKYLIGCFFNPSSPAEREAATAWRPGSESGPSDQCVWWRVLTGRLPRHLLAVCQ